MSKIPPPPTGFTIDADEDIPPPPAGFVMDGAPTAAGVTPARAGSVEAPGPRAAAELQGYRSPRSGWRYGSDLAEKIGQGAFMSYGDEIAALAGSLPHVITGGRFGKSRQEILDEVRGREKEFEADHPVAAAAGELGGAVATGLGTGIGALRVAGATPTLLRAAGTAGLSSAPLGAIDATGRMEGDHTVREYGAEAGKGALISGLVGAGIGGAGNIAGRVVGPWANRLATELTNRGVRLTPGELIGGRLGRMEDNAAALPIIGDMIRARADEGVESLNRASYLDALGPLGQRYQRMFQRQGARVGHESVDEISDILEHRYRRVVPRMTAAIDNDMINEATAIANRLPASVIPEFRDIVQRHIDSVLDPNTLMMPGDRLQQSLRSMRDAADRLQRSTASPWHPELGEAVRDLRTALENSMARHSNPRDVTAFQNINRAYSRYAIVRDAASRVTSEEGVFRPANLHGAVRAADRSAGKGDMARGRMRMQDLSGPARALMRPKGAGSPTTERLALIGALTNPAMAAKLLAYGIPAAALYSRAGNRAFQTAATVAPGARALARLGIERASGAAAPVFGYEAERP